MQNVITWEQLLIYLLIPLGIYYMVVLVLYYREELSRLSRRFSKQDGSGIIHRSEDSSVSEKKDFDNLYDGVHALMKDCREIFSNVTNAPIDRGRLVEDLRAKVGLFPQIKGTAFQVSLSNHFAQEASHRLNIELEDDELEKIWQ